jgi:hypothetical protein
MPLFQAVCPYFKQWPLFVSIQWTQSVWPCIVISWKNGSMTCTWCTLIPKNTKTGPTSMSPSTCMSSFYCLVLSYCGGASLLSIWSVHWKRSTQTIRLVVGTIIFNPLSPLFNMYSSRYLGEYPLEITHERCQSSKVVEQVWLSWNYLEIQGFVWQSIFSWWFSQLWCTDFLKNWHFSGSLCVRQRNTFHVIVAVSAENI